MTVLKDVPADVAERARVVIQLAENTEAIHAVDILTPWVRQDPDLFVQVMLAIALMSDPDRMLKDAHSAYTRGDRSPTIVELERRYQRNRGRKNREYKMREDSA